MCIVLLDLPKAMTGKKRSAIWGYGIALLSVLGTHLFRRMLDPVIGHDTPFAFLFLLPPIISARYGGLGPGILATFLSITGDKVSLATSTSEFARLTRISTFFLVGGLLCYLFERQRKTEEILRQSRILLNQIFQSPVFGIAVLNKKGRFIEANDSFLSMTGYDAVDLATGKINWKENTPPEYWKRDENALAECYEKSRFLSYQKELFRSDGKRIPVLVGGSALEGDQGNIVCFFLDLSERFHLESQIRHLQKLETLSQLSAGIAHDFNNILTIIDCQVELIKSSKDLPQSTHQQLDHIALAASRANYLTRQLMTFCRQQIFAPSPLDLANVVQRLTPMLNAMADQKIRISVINADKPAPIIGDRGMIEQVILNLCLNARDAMPEGGELTIRIGEENVETAKHRGAFVLLTVQDSGQGMDASVQEHIFEPFFTTKGTGQGSGLGLSTVYGIVSQHGGWIDVTSEPKKGSLFRVYFPKFVEHVHATSKVSSVKKILVVDDEEVIRQLAQLILEKSGFQVFTAPNADDALVLFSKEKPFDLIISDILMPGSMNGLDLVKRIRKEHPRQKVIMISGYQDESVSKLEPDMLFIPKPFKPATLSSMALRYLS